MIFANAAETPHRFPVGVGRWFCLPRTTTQTTHRQQLVSARPRFLPPTDAVPANHRPEVGKFSYADAEHWTKPGEKPPKTLGWCRPIATATRCAEPNSFPGKALTDNLSEMTHGSQDHAPILPTRTRPSRMSYREGELIGGDVTGLRICDWARLWSGLQSIPSLTW